MHRRNFLHTLGACTTGFALSGCAIAPKPASHKRQSTRPNIVYILADDLGYGDIRALNKNSGIPTPNLDRLAKTGMVFTDAHAGAAVCTPTRYGVLTGRYSWRTHMKSGVLKGYSPHLIDPERTTVASLLKQNGYTTGCVGKWHLGMDFSKTGPNPQDIDYSKPIVNGPNRLGFDYFYGICASLDFPPYVYIENDRVTELPTAKQEASAFPAFMREGERSPGFIPVETLDVLTGKTIDFIERQSTDSSPFFLYFPMTAPHKPTIPSPQYQGRSGLGPYGDFVAQVDGAVGRVMDALTLAGVKDNTLVIFTSDNGSYMRRLEEGANADHTNDPAIQGYRPSSHNPNYYFRGTKADIWEAGHRIPYIAHWPGIIEPGTRCDTPICLTDLMATCADIISRPLSANTGEDSFSTLPLMLGQQRAIPRAPVLHQSGNGTLAIRKGDWKLVLSSGSGGREKPVGEPWSEPYQLFNIKNNPQESHNMAASNPEIVRELTKEIQRYIDHGRTRYTGL